MEAVLQSFVARLRENGLRASTSELIDAAEAATLVGLGDPERLRQALQATLVKRAADRRLFDRLFDLHFRAGLAVADETGPGIEGSGLPPEVMEALRAALAGLSGRLGGLTEALLAGRAGEVARRLSGAAEAAGLAGMEGFLQQGRYTLALLNAAGLRELEADIAALQAALEAGGVPAEVRERIQDLLRERVARLRAAARREVSSRWRARNLASTDPDLGGLLEERSMSSLSRDEIERMKEVVERLARRLRDRLDRRRRVRRRGAFDMHRTLRRSLAYGGLPITPAFRQRRRDRPEIVLLVDVSDSVRNVARFFLQFAYALQHSVHRMRSFLFVAEVGEATELFRRTDVHRAVDLAFAGRVLNLHARSNYGRALSHFARDHLGVVNRRTTVFVVGDGRNNYNPPREAALEELRRRARRLVWLCPEDRFSWGFGDSAMHLYARHCDRVEVVRKVADLRRVVELALT